MFHWPAKPYQSAEIRKSTLYFQGGAGIRMIKTLAQCFQTNLYEAS